MRFAAILLVLLALVAMMLTGCGSDGGVDGPSPEAEPRASEPVREGEQADPTPEVGIDQPAAEGELTDPGLEAEADGPGAEDRAADVVVNGVALSADTIRTLQQQYAVEIQDGNYWYDSFSGAWGLEGGPTLGFIVGGLQLGGPLAANASGGGTAVFINGRELHPAESSALEQLLGPIALGRYWLDVSGDYGSEGGPPLGNLIDILQSVGGGGYVQDTYGGYIGGDGQTSYFFDPETGCSVLSGEGVSC